MIKSNMISICEALGLELGDEFVFKPYPELIFTFTATELSFKFNERFYVVGIPEYDATNLLFEMIKSDKDQIQKLPWIPKKGELYYTFSYSCPDDEDLWGVSTSMKWNGCVIDQALLKQGWVFKTSERARKALPKIAESMNVKYEL